jgi:phosphomannomutase
MDLDPSIFKAYDIRGIYGEQIDGDLAEQIARAFAQVIAEQVGKQPRDLGIALSHDMRLSSPELAERYKAGLMAEGVHVMDAGEAATEILYYLVGSRGLDGGLACTASHNPAAYTGAKLVGRGALPLSGESGIDRVARKIEAGLGRAPGGGSQEMVEWRRGFDESVMRFVDRGAIRGLRVVLDGGNGMAGPMVGPILDRLGLELVETYWTPDGNFPDHEPNPLLEENRRFIIEKVRAERADIGIAFDGDADRCFFIDEQGEFVAGDFMTALFARSLLHANPGAAILYDVRASRAVADTVAAEGGHSYPNRVGHAFFKRRMREEGSLFGGEVSGHYYFREFFCADSGTIPALIMLELAARAGKPVSELLRPYREKYFISGEINSEVSDQRAKLALIKERYADAEQSSLDGISIDYPDWHFNVRSSNTEPLLRLCLESLVSNADMERRRDEVLGLIRA